MSHLRINGRNISRHWLNRQSKLASHHDRELLKMCVLMLLWNYIDAIAKIKAALAELTRDGVVHKLPGDYYQLRR